MVCPFSLKNGTKSCPTSQQQRWTFSLHQSCPEIGDLRHRQKSWLVLESTSNCFCYECLSKEVESPCLPESIIIKRAWNKSGVGKLAPFHGARVCGAEPSVIVYLCWQCRVSQGWETGWNCTFSFDVITSCRTVIRNSDSKPRETAVHLLDLKLS